MECFAKRIMPECRCPTRSVSGQGAGEVCETRALQYRFRQKHQKKKPRKETFGVFSPRYSEKYNLNGKFNSKMNTIRAFLSKIKTLFLIFRKARGGLALVALL